MGYFSGGMADKNVNKVGICTPRVIFKELNTGVKGRNPY